MRIRLEKEKKEVSCRGSVGERKMQLVSWKTEWMYKKFGGLGIRKLDVLNSALLGNSLWRYANEQDSLLRKIIQGKFGEVVGG